MVYRARVIDGELADSLASVGAVVIEGPKACGKTETARRLARSEVRLDVDQAARQAIAIAPSLVLDGPTPRLIDEWQAEPDIWNHVRRAVDDRGQPGQFILTGSAVPRDDVIRHTGAGRFTHLRMRPMTLSETGNSTDLVSLADVLAGRSVACPEPGLTVQDLAERLAIGGWPAYLGLNSKQAQRAMRGYLGEICNVDVRRLDGIKRDPRSVMRFIQSIARNTATPAKLQTLVTDANGTDGSMHIDTGRAYLDVLARLHITDDVPAWNPSLRSNIRLRQASIRHLADPALAMAVGRATPGKLLADLNSFGLLFESMVVRDLRVYASAVGGEVFHYHDENGLEADAIIEMPDGGWAAFEVKLGASTAIVDAAAANLLKLSAKVDAPPPVALGVITGSGYGLVRKDGVLQIPIGALRR